MPEGWFEAYPNPPSFAVNIEIKAENHDLEERFDRIFMAHFHGLPTYADTKSSFRRTAFSIAQPNPTSLFDGSTPLDIDVQGAQQHHAPSMMYLGKMFLYGQGFPVDYDMALLWFEKTAEEVNRVIRYPQFVTCFVCTASHIHPGSVYGHS